MLRTTAGLAQPPSHATVTTPPRAVEALWRSRADSNGATDRRCPTLPTDRLRTTIRDGEAAEEKAIDGLLARKGVPASDATEASESIAQASIARLALPKAEKKSKEVSDEVAKLRQEVSDAAKRQLVSDAGIVLGEYQRRITALCALYDQLLGIKSALIGEVGHEAIEIPLFTLKQYSEPAKHLHTAFGGTGDIRQSTIKARANWMQAFEKLVSSADADISDLIGVAT